MTKPRKTLDFDISSLVLPRLLLCYLFIYFYSLGWHVYEAIKGPGPRVDIWTTAVWERQRSSSSCLHHPTASSLLLITNMSFGELHMFFAILSSFRLHSDSFSNTQTSHYIQWYTIYWCMAGKQVNNKPNCSAINRTTSVLIDYLIALVFAYRWTKLTSVGSLGSRRDNSDKHLSCSRLLTSCWNNWNSIMFSHLPAEMQLLAEISSVFCLW
jgi:hypothetical protein